eukprot:11192644-Lingulodinium_polyedra.AAC.1
MNRDGAYFVWLNHGCNLIRGAPEHLRYATDAEWALFEHQHGTMDLLTDLQRGQSKQFKDMGPPPTPAQRNAAERNYGPDDPRMDDEEMPTATASP